MTEPRDRLRESVLNSTPGEVGTPFVRGLPPEIVALSVERLAAASAGLAGLIAVVVALHQISLELGARELAMALVGGPAGNVVASILAALSLGMLLLTRTRRVEPRLVLDLGSLYAVAYWMLTGQRVFEGETPLAVLMSHANSEPTPMSERTEQRIPAELEAVVLGCLAKDPGDRPPDAAALAQQLSACEELSSWSREKALRWWKAHLPDRMAMHGAGDLRNDRARQ